MKKRVFIALSLSQKVKEELTELVSQAKKINSAPVIRYVKLKGIHLTLHFLGYLVSKQINQVKTVLNNLANNYSTATLISNKINAFPNLKNPRVIFLECREEEGENLVSLQKNLGEELEKIGLDVDHRAWHPHLTLARIKGSTIFKTENIKIPNLKIPIKSIELMESQLHPQGAEYKILESYSLKPRTHNP